MTGGSIAGTDLKTSGLDPLELSIKCENSFDLGFRHIEIGGNSFDGIVGNISFLLLNQLKTLDEISLLVSYLFKIGIV